MGTPPAPRSTVGCLGEDGDGEDDEDGAPGTERANAEPVPVERGDVERPAD
ncbi:MAG: hypothetical protein ACR2OB_06855 [Solirubrobacteraceae bacterium]